MGHIIPFSSKYAADFLVLNKAWLDEFFYVEAHDLDLMSRCKEEIIDKGGYIFFYQEAGAVVGTFALIKVDEGIFELGKMAVSEEQRGQGIGQEMMRYCLNYGKEQHWKKILLYSNTKLNNSIHIYRKFGFAEVDLERGNPYERANIKMEYNYSVI